MKNMLWGLLLLPLFAQATTIAVIDSGVDVEHVDFTNNIWMNPTEIADNGRDEDRNGYQDNVYGWNFAEQNNLVIDRKYLGTFSNDPYRLFEIQERVILETVTEEDMKWLEEKRKDPKFMKEVQKFGNFIHGTHVAGISVDKTDSQIISVKLIPTEVLPTVNRASTENPYGDVPKDLRMNLVKYLLGQLAAQQALALEEIGAYVNGHKADIANGSFGTGFKQAAMIGAIVYKTVFGKNPSQKHLVEVTYHFMMTLIKESKQMVDAAPNTLFVFAAGNDGSNNDIMPTSPTNIDAKNVISVAATFKRNVLANFSNYGKKTVDVAAPGVIINSQIPGNEYIKVSGTSQAAPYVANIAAQIKTVNPALKPSQIKKIIMNTVDEKGFLKGKVKSNGIVNAQRAVVAAEHTLSGRTIDSAIKLAKVEIADIESDILGTEKTILPFIVPIQLPAQFKL